MTNLNKRAKKDLIFSRHHLMNFCKKETNVKDFYKECFIHLNGLSRFRIRISSPKEKELEDYGIFRARECYEGVPFENVKDLWEPPSEVTKLGRCNDVKSPMFYCSNHLGTALIETGATNGSCWCLGEFSIISNDLECILMGLKEQSFLKQDTNYKHVDFWPKKKEILDSYLYNVFRKNGKRKKNVYIQTAAITQFVLNPEFTKNVDGVIYPSVACGHNGINIAINPDRAREKLILQKVLFIQIENINQKQVKYRVLSEGEVEGERIKWKGEY